MYNTWILYYIIQGMYDVVLYAIFVQCIKWIDIVFPWISHNIPIEFPQYSH
jgi:hypothetical protein